MSRAATSPRWRGGSSRISRNITNTTPKRRFKYNNIEQENRNPLVQKGLADGLKTGHTDAGGYGLVASAHARRPAGDPGGERPGHRCSQRAEESERLLDWAFREFEDVTLFTAGDMVEQAPVWLGTAPTVPLVGGRDLVVTMPRDWRSKAKIAVEYDSPIRAPVARGDDAGPAHGQPAQGVPDMSVPLLAGADVPRLGLPGRALAVLSHMVTGG